MWTDVTRRFLTTASRRATRTESEGTRAECNHPTAVRDRRPVNRRRGCGTAARRRARFWPLALYDAREGLTATTRQRHHARGGCLSPLDVSEPVAVGQAWPLRRGFWAGSKTTTVSRCISTIGATTDARSGNGEYGFEDVVKATPRGPNASRPGEDVNGDLDRFYGQTRPTRNGACRRAALP